MSANTSKYRVINIFAPNGLTDDKGTVADVAQIKRLMTCITKEVPHDYIMREVHLKRDYSVVMEEINGKIHDVKYFI